MQPIVEEPIVKEMEVEKVWDLGYYGEVVLLRKDVGNHLRIEISPKNFTSLPKEGDRYKVIIQKI